MMTKERQGKYPPLPHPKLILFKTNYYDRGMHPHGIIISWSENSHTHNKNSHFIHKIKPKLPDLFPDAAKSGSVLTTPQLGCFIAGT